MIQSTILITNCDDARFHIPGAHNMQQTLCGYVDAGYQQRFYKDSPVNCTACIDALKKIRAMKFPQKYFKPAKKKSESILKEAK